MCYMKLFFVLASFFRNFGGGLVFVREISSLSQLRSSSTKLGAKYFDANGDPIKPALSAYMHFCADERRRVTDMLRGQMGTEFKATEVLVKLGEMWRGKIISFHETAKLTPYSELDGDSVKRYQSKAAQDKERYNAEVVAAGYERKTAEKKASRPKSVRDCVLRCNSNGCLQGYMYFCADRREAITADLRRSMGVDFRATAVRFDHPYFVPEKYLLRR